MPQLHILTCPRACFACATICPHLSLLFIVVLCGVVSAPSQRMVYCCLQDLRPERYGSCLAVSLKVCWHSESMLLLLLQRFADPCMLSCCMVVVVDLHAMQVGEVQRRGPADASISFSHSCSYEGVYAADTAWCPGAPACCSFW